jgi:hypothetical protein
MTCLTWVTLPGTYVPASTILWVIWAQKSPHHNKTVALKEDFRYEEMRNSFIPYITLEVLVGLSIKISAFLDVTSCSLVGQYQRFGGNCLPHLWFTNLHLFTSQKTVMSLILCLWWTVFEPEVFSNLLKWQNWFYNIPFFPSDSQVFFFLTLNTLCRRVQMEWSRNEKCNSLWLLVHSLSSYRSSSVDVITLEITIYDYCAFATK